MAQITPGTPEALTALLTQIRQGTAPGSADPAAAPEWDRANFRTTSHGCGPGTLDQCHEVFKAFLPNLCSISQNLEPSALLFRKHSR